MSAASIAEQFGDAPIVLARTTGHDWHHTAYFDVTVEPTVDPEAVQVIPRDPDVPDDLPRVIGWQAEHDKFRLVHYAPHPVVYALYRADNPHVLADRYKKALADIEIAVSDITELALPDLNWVNVDDMLGTVRARTDAAQAALNALRAALAEHNMQPSELDPED